MQKPIVVGAARSAPCAGPSRANARRARSPPSPRGRPWSASGVGKAEDRGRVRERCARGDPVGRRSAEQPLEPAGAAPPCPNSRSRRARRRAHGRVDRRDEAAIGGARDTLTFGRAAAARASNGATAGRCSRRPRAGCGGAGRCGRTGSRTGVPGGRGHCGSGRSRRPARPSAARAGRVGDPVEGASPRRRQRGRRIRNATMPSIRSRRAR